MLDMYENRMMNISRQLKQDNFMPYEHKIALIEELDRLLIAYNQAKKIIDNQ